MSDVQCQNPSCGQMVSHRDAVFYGPPSTVTWLCKECASRHAANQDRAQVGMRRPVRAPSPEEYADLKVERAISAASLAPRQQPVETFSPSQVVEAVGTQAADIHRLRFELAHVIKHFDDHGVPDDLSEWHKNTKQLLRETNKGQPWDVER